MLADLPEPGFSPDAATCYLRSLIQASRGELTAAAENLQKAAQFDRTYQFAALHQANALFYDRRYQEARRLYQEIANRKLDTDGLALYRLADCEKVLGRRKQAAAIWEKLLTRDPQNEVLYLELGDYRRAAGDLREAERLYQKGLAIDPQNRELSSALAGLYFQQGAWGRAKDCLSPLLGIYPNYAPLYAQLAQIAEKEHQPEMAEKYYQALLRLDPENRVAREKVKPAPDATGVF